MTISGIHFVYGFELNIYQTLKIIFNLTKKNQGKKKLSLGSDLKLDPKIKKMLNGGKEKKAENQAENKAEKRKKIEDDEDKENQGGVNQEIIKVEEVEEVNKQLIKTKLTFNRNEDYKIDSYYLNLLELPHDIIEEQSYKNADYYHKFYFGVGIFYDFKLQKWNQTNPKIRIEYGIPHYQSDVKDKLYQLCNQAIHNFDLEIKTFIIPNGCQCCP